MKSLVRRLLANAEASTNAGPRTVRCRRQPEGLNASHNLDIEFLAHCGQSSEGLRRAEGRENGRARAAVQAVPVVIPHRHHDGVEVSRNRRFPTSRRWWQHIVKIS